MSFFQRLYNIFMFNRPRFHYRHRSIRDLLTYTAEEKAIDKALDFISFNKVTGDYLEFGVYQGNTFAWAYNFAKAKNIKMHFYAYDSFQGLPTDKEGFFQKGEYSCDLISFLKHLQDKNVDLADVTTIKGYYKHSLKKKRKLNLQKASLVWIDCDLHESTSQALEYITPYLQDGTVIVFDDWYCYKNRPDKGEQRAFKEWKNKVPHLSFTDYGSYGWNVKMFIVNTRQK